MLTIVEFNDFCAARQITVRIYRERNYNPKQPYHWNVVLHYEDNGTDLEVKRQAERLEDAINLACAGICQISREGFKFPVMLEAPTTELRETHDDHPF